MIDTDLVYSTIECDHCHKQFRVKMHNSAPKPETKFVKHVDCGNEMPIKLVMNQIKAAKHYG